MCLLFPWQGFDPEQMTPALALMRKRNDELKPSLYRIPKNFMPRERPHSSSFLLDWRRSLAETDREQYWGARKKIHETCSVTSSVTEERQLPAVDSYNLCSVNELSPEQALTLKIKPLLIWRMYSICWFDVTLNLMIMFHCIYSVFDAMLYFIICLNK